MIGWARLEMNSNAAYSFRFPATILLFDGATRACRQFVKYMDHHHGSRDSGARQYPPKLETRADKRLDGVNTHTTIPPHKVMSSHHDDSF